MLNSTLIINTTNIFISDNLISIDLNLCVKEHVSEYISLNLILNNFDKKSTWELAAKKQYQKTWRIVSSFSKQKYKIKDWKSREIINWIKNNLTDIKIGILI